eukprot:CAMPEP_0179192574 /NCGR_PEP_ID=MMETSP0796-20121207/95685_1 /TAXON_ID=73915 /ORGANISM="Pyrodinium bahamense, Strain pbaha01" /LENGTH=71 /DNA_ID=CAMNT_0020896859 /DNA_START=69 /DNA_END=280 /DNA_ORIENTATION=+
MHGLGHRHLPEALANFYDVKCAPGFQCVSKVAVFGLNHSGAYEKPPVVEVEPRFREAYETGCPARGTFTTG